MKKQLIEKVNGEKQQYEALILKANRDILMYQEKLGRLEDGTDDERLKKVLNELKSKKNYIEGLIFLHKELEKNLRGLYKDDGSCTDIAFALAIKNNIKVNEDSYKNSSKKWSNTRDFFYIFSFFAVITIIGWILLNMVKYKKRCR